MGREVGRGRQGDQKGMTTQPPKSQPPRFWSGKNEVAKDRTWRGKMVAKLSPGFSLQTLSCPVIYTSLAHTHPLVLKLCLWMHSFPCSPRHSPGDLWKMKFLTSSSEKQQASTPRTRSNVPMPVLHSSKVWVGHRGVHMIVGIYNIIQTLCLQHWLWEHHSLLPGAASFAQ